MAKRRSWDSLSPNYRRRLERGGIGREEYESGQSLAKARGHGSSQKENVRRKQRRELRKWAEHQGDYYYRDPDEIYEYLLSQDYDLMINAMETQQEAERLYLEGDKIPARMRWQMREPDEYDLPDWLFFYHGVFNW